MANKVVIASRLNEETASIIAEIANAEGVTQSQVIRECVEMSVHARKKLCTPRTLPKLEIPKNL